MYHGAKRQAYAISPLFYKEFMEKNTPPPLSKAQRRRKLVRWFRGLFLLCFLLGLATGFLAWEYFWSGFAPKEASSFGEAFLKGLFSPFFILLFLTLSILHAGLVGLGIYVFILLFMFLKGHWQKDALLRDLAWEYLKIVLLIGVFFLAFTVTKSLLAA
ncbi:MAG: hypothetical protein OHK0053_16160 [Microscillaceae bacterium]